MTTDQDELRAAQQYMGGFAWPTVLLGVVVFFAYILVPLLVAGEQLPLWLGTLLMAVLTYMAYTVLHDAAHGSISGSNQSLRWLNECMGYLAGFMMMIPMTAHRHEHLSHHRNTNDPEADPDYVVADLLRSPWYPLYAIAGIIVSQYRYYFSQRWGKGPRSQDVKFCLELVAIIGFRVLFMVQGYWLEGAVLFLVGGLGGVFITMYLFAYLVHHPHQTMGRYVDTSTFDVPGSMGGIVTWLWLFQNYHAIHHLFPRVPFYHYRKLFYQIEPVMLANGAPIYRPGKSALFDQVAVSKTA